MRKVLKAGILAGAGLLAAACAVVAPRPLSPERRRTWEYLRGFRYAHRGLHDNAIGVPENSLPAFELAARHGFGSELDVHLTSDGQLVVVHDSDLSRLTGEQGIVEDLTLEELSERRLLGTDERIPLFSAVLDLYDRLAPAAPLIVEVKTYGGNHAELTAATMAELDRHEHPYCVESFDPLAVRWLRANRGDVFRGQLAQDFMREGAHSGKGTHVDLALTILAGNAVTRPDFVAYRWSDASEPVPMLTTAVLGACYVGWTLHSADELLACERRGGIGIFEGFVPDATPAR